MPRGSAISPEKEMEIYHFLNAHPELTQSQIAVHFSVSDSTLSRIKKKFFNFSKTNLLTENKIISINRVDDLLLLLSDAIFKVRFGNMDPHQARVFGYLVNSYFKILLDRTKVKDDSEINIKDYLATLSNAELRDLAKE